MKETILALFSVLLLTFSGMNNRLQAQSGNAVVDGVIEDPSGAIVPGCELKLVNIATGGVLTTQSDGAGLYVFPSVKAGSYTLQIAIQGFKSYSLSDFRVTVGQHATQNVMLELGPSSQSITIEASGSAPLLEPKSNEFGTLIESVSVQQLPLNGRNYLQLGYLSGAAENGGTSVSNFLSVQTGHTDRDITIAGTEQDLIGFTVNGVSVAGSRLGEASLNVSISAIDQFKVVQGFILPAMGPDPGIVNVVTKSGTNGLHGEAFEFLRNNALDARNFFEAQPHPGPFRRNQFGGAVGGRSGRIVYSSSPIMRDSAKCWRQLREVSLPLRTCSTAISPFFPRRFTTHKPMILAPACGSLSPATSFRRTGSIPWPRSCLHTTCQAQALPRAR